MSVHIRISKGHRPSSKGAPAQISPSETHQTNHAAVLGSDFLPFQPRMEVSQNDHVAAGQIVCRDRKTPDVAFVAPIDGRVASIDFGARRTLSAIIIEADKKGKKTPKSKPLDHKNDEAVRATLLERGLWPAFQTRPFGRIPLPDEMPAAIFVNAAQTSKLAPEPGIVLKNQSEEFHLGIELLKRLTTGTIHVCQAPGETLCPAAERVAVTFFSGTYAAGLSGTHINRLHRTRAGCQVWSIDYQNVAAMGHLFLTGQYRSDRVVAIAGPGAAQPRLIRTCLGASIKELSKNEVVGDRKSNVTRILSGTALTGRDAAFLGRFHNQITITEQPSENVITSLFHRLLGSQKAIVPTNALESALAVDILPVPLLRALSVGDSEAAERLGCLELLEEDVAALTTYCASGADYAALLRQTLNDLAEQAA